MSVIYTIGYEGTDIRKLVETLKVVGIKQLADVRAIAHSRKRGFSKKGLSAHLEAESIEYFHFVDLGDPQPGRDAAKAGLYDQFRDIYTSHMCSAEAQLSLNLLIATARKKPTCLLCFERDPQVCHRSIIAEEMSVFGFEVFDLYGDEPERYVRNASKMPCHYSCESVAAAE